MPQLRWPLLLGLLLIAAFTLGACGSDDDDDDVDGGGGGTVTADAATTEDSDAADADEAAATEAEVEAEAELTVVLKEWAVEPEVASITAGEVAVIARNEGTSGHELVIIRSDLPADGLPTASAMVDEEAVEVVLRIDVIAGGSSALASVTLGAGSYVLICNIPGHYDLKMRAAFTVN